MSEWMPIETAPKDGRMVLLGFAGESQIVCVGQWVEMSVNADYYDMLPCWVGWVWGSPSALIDPSHWMPLPEPPK